MPYQLISLETNEPVSSMVYDTASEAANARTMYSFKTRIVAVADPDDTSWIDRERKRLEDGTYTPVPDWFQEYCLPLHFTHLSKGCTLADAMLSFTESPLKGQQDIQLRLPVNRYLARFHQDKLSSDQIAAITNRFGFTDYTLTIEQTEAAFVFAYENQEVRSESSSHVSCMWYGKDHYGTPKHPSAVYYTGATEDSLAIAYIKNPNNPSNVLARALVWPHRQTFVRIYGVDERMRGILRALLTNEGYNRDSDFEGARIRRIPFGVDRHFGNDRYIMPYIDGDVQCVDVMAGNDRFFVIDRHGDYACTDTRGYIYDHNRYTCDNCGDGMDEDEAHSVQGDTWCQHCYENSSFFCERHQETYPDSTDSHQVITMVRYRYNDPRREPMTQTWSEFAVNDEAFFCENTERYYDTRYFSQIEVHVLRSGRNTTETWCQERTLDDYFICPDCDEAYEHVYLSATTNADGDQVCTFCAEKIEAREAECEDNLEPVKLRPVTPTIHDTKQLVLDWQLAPHEQF